MITGALAGWVLTARSLRQWPELVAWVVMSSVVLSTVVTGLAVPSLTVQSVGYLLLLPGLVALVLPWRTTMHLRWLLAYVVLVAVYLSLDPVRRFSASERNDLLVVVVVAVGASLAGHVLLRRGQIHAFAQLEHIRALRRRADADMVELERVHHALELTARIDPLTGTGNRRRLVEDLRAVRAHIHRSGMTYGFIEIDIDHFKQVNDSLGHLAGDEVLREVVVALQSTLRATDAIYRYGGEEFLVILPVASDDALRRGRGAAEVGRGGAGGRPPGARRARRHHREYRGDADRGDQPWPIGRRVVRPDRPGPVRGQGRRPEPGLHPRTRRPPDRTLGGLADRQQPPGVRDGHLLDVRVRSRRPRATWAGTAPCRYV